MKIIVQECPNCNHLTPQIRKDIEWLGLWSAPKDKAFLCLVCGKRLKVVKGETKIEVYDLRGSER